MQSFHYFSILFPACRYLLLFSSNAIYSPSPAHRRPTYRLRLHGSFCFFGVFSALLWFNERFYCAICSCCSCCCNTQREMRENLCPGRFIRIVAFHYERCAEEVNSQRMEMSNRWIWSGRQLGISLFASQVHIPKLT